MDRIIRKSLKKWIFISILGVAAYLGGYTLAQLQRVADQKAAHAPQ